MLNTLTKFTRHTATRREREGGFTIVELLVVIVVLGLMIGIVFGSIDNLYQSNIRDLGVTTQTADNGASLHMLQNSIAPAANFLATNTITDPQGTVDKSGGIHSGQTWNFAGNSNTGGNGNGADTNSEVLILSTFATDTSSTNSSTNLIYTAGPAAGGACAGNTNVPLMNNYVFYVAHGNLYRRTIVDTTSARCSSNSPAQVQTCAQSTNLPSACKGTDPVLLTGVTSFTVAYYATPNSSSPIGTIYTNTIPGPVVQATQTVVITITTQQRINGATNTYSTPIRVSHYN